MANLTTNLKLRKPEITDIEVVEIDVANNFSIIDARIGFVICTSTSRPADPFPGLKILESDTGLPYIYLPVDGWFQMGVIPSATVAGAKGYKGSATNTTNYSSTSSTETIITQLNTTFTSEVGRRYAVEANLADINLIYPNIFPFQPQGYVNLRWAAGSTVTTSGTLINTRPFTLVNVNGAEYFFGIFSPEVAGNVTVGIGFGFCQGVQMDLLHSETVGSLTDSLFVRDIGPSSW